MSAFKEWAEQGQKMLDENTDLPKEQKLLMQIKIDDARLTGTLLLEKEVAAAEESNVQAPQSTAELVGEVPSPISSIYVIKHTGLVLPSASMATELVASASTQLGRLFHKRHDIPEPPAGVFEQLEHFAKNNINGFDHVYPWSELQLTQDDPLWKEQPIQPSSSFWMGIGSRNFPPDVAILRKGWFIGERRIKPDLHPGVPRYENDFLADLMRDLTTSKKIAKAKGVVSDSRFGTSALAIITKIIPAWKESNIIAGNLRMRRYIEFLMLGIMGNTELGKTTSVEWFGDRVYDNDGDAYLYGGGSRRLGFRDVVHGTAGVPISAAGFSLVVEFPSL